MRRHFQDFCKQGFFIKGFGGGPSRRGGQRKSPDGHAPAVGRSPAPTYWRRAGLAIVAIFWGVILWLLVFHCC